jgi:methylmalonyl-CoA decarboxylase subunit alpha
MSFKRKIQEIETLRAKIKQGDGDKTIALQHDDGKLTAIERVEKLLDPGSFLELELFSKPIETGLDVDENTIRGDGIVTGYGEVSGRPICVWAQDITIGGGFCGITHSAKMVRLLERALKARVPCIGIIDSKGIRTEDIITTPSNYSYDAMAQIQTKASGVIPQISLIMGPCLGAATISAFLSDFVFMVKKSSYACVASPSGDVEENDVGGALLHAKKSGCCDVLAENENECIKKTREILSYLPLNNTDRMINIDTGDPPDRLVDEVTELVPIDSRKPFNMRKLVSIIVDNDKFFEIKKGWAANLIVGFARLGGRSVGIIANNPLIKGGCLDVDSSDKHARFVRFCDAFNIPLIYFADTPAFLPSVKQERKGIIRHGAKTVFANSVATTPQIQVYIRKCYGGGNLAMPGNNLGGDFGIAWPSAELFLMHPEGAVSIINRKDISTAKDPQLEFRSRVEQFRSMGAVENIWEAMTIQDYIKPKDTRAYLIKTLKFLEGKSVGTEWKRHDNMPL